MINLIFLAGILSFFVLMIAIFPLKRCSLTVCIGVSLGLLLVFALSYWMWGGWREYFAYQQVLEKRTQAEAVLQSMGDVETVIERLRTQVMQHPKQVKGWYLLGRLYASQNQWANAAHAFATANQLKPDDERITLNWAQSLLATENPQSIEQAKRLLNHLLTQHPNQLDALAMLAMEADARHAYAEALEYWQRVLMILPPNAEEANQIRDRIEQLQAKISSSSK